MADANSYSGDEYTDDEEDGEELDPRVQVKLTLVVVLMLFNSVCIQLCKWDLETSQKFCNFTSHRTNLKDSTSLQTQ